MYSTTIEKLIEHALADGELRENERNILLKKAVAEGIDIDEFNMVLDARLFEKIKSKAETAPVAAPKSDKVSEIKKCPACGATVQSFSTKCSDCGHDFRNVESANSVREFFREYQNIENKVVLRDRNNSRGLIGKLLGGFEFIGGGDWKRAVFTRKKEFIMHFPISNSKEDILEFLSIAFPLASPAKKSTLIAFKKFGAHFGGDEAKNYDFMIAEVWLQKCEQIVMKARLSMREDRKTLEEVEYYGRELGIK